MKIADDLKNENETYLKAKEQQGKTALQKLDQAKFSWYHVKILLVNGVGFFTDAYDIFVISFAMSMLGCIYYKDNNNSVPVYIDTLVKASSQVGALIGQVLFGVLSDISGRKKMYGVELMIIVIGTVGSCFSANLVKGFSVFTVLGIWRLFLGIGLGGDYPLSATITSEFSSARHRGAMVSAVFSMQGLGILAVSIVTLIFLSIFKPLIQADPDNLDYVWRLIIGFGCIPAVVAIYFRMTISETPRYTIEINDDVDKAVKDVECVLNQKYVRNEKKSETTKKATFREFITYFSKWKRFKVLFATSISWFCLDVGFYGINMNTNIIIQAIGFSGKFTTIKYLNETVNGSNFTTVTDVYPVLFNNAVGNIIICGLGLLPGYWVSIFTIDRMGRKPIQLLGFGILTVVCGILSGFYHQIINFSTTWFVVIFVIAQFFHNFGPNTTTFVIPSEVFNTRFRSTAHGISAAMGKLGAIISQAGLLQLKDKFGGKDSGIPVLFGIFAGFMFIGFLVTFMIPETKGRSLEDISDEMDKSDIDDDNDNDEEAGKDAVVSQF